MRRQKRNMADRAYNKGYMAGVGGKSKETCPLTHFELRQQWLNGWREGRADQWDGYVGVSGIHKQARMI